MTHMTRLALASFLALGTLGGVRAQSSVLTINSVVVLIGPGGYWSPSVTRWQFPITLEAGQDVILASKGAGDFNTSFAVGPYPARLWITVNGVRSVFEDASGILNVRGLNGQHAPSANKAQEWGEPMIGPGYLLYVGYADTVHADPCGSYATSIGLIGASECVPAGFRASTFFQGAPAVQEVGGIVGYDSGVIRIIVTE